MSCTIVAVGKDYLPAEISSRELSGGMLESITKVGGMVPLSCPRCPPTMVTASLGDLVISAGGVPLKNPELHIIHFPNDGIADAWLASADAQPLKARTKIFVF